MKKCFLLGLLFAASIVNANGLSETCASLQLQVEKLGESKAREMGLGQVIDMCAKEDTSAHKEKMQSGTLYCTSGDLCATYDFTHSSDRKIYQKSCSQVASCPTDYKDKCTVYNDPVKNGTGTVDWTIYSYNAKLPDNIKKQHCQ